MKLDREYKKNEDNLEYSVSDHFNCFALLIKKVFNSLNTLNGH